MALKKNVVVKTVLNFSDIDSFNSVLAMLEDGKTYFRLGGKLLIENMQRDIEREYLEPLLTKLRKYPPKRKKGDKMRWKSERQRRYVMMMIAKGEISHDRTGALKRGWQADVTLDFGAKNLLTVRIQNTAKQRVGKGKGQPYAQYVMGSIGLGKARRSQQRYKRPQQPFHQDTGWKLAYEIIQPAVFDIEDAVDGYVDEWIVNGIELLASGRVIG